MGCGAVRALTRHRFRAIVFAGPEDLAERVEREIAKSMADAGMPDMLGIEARSLIPASCMGTRTFFLCCHVFS